MEWPAKANGTTPLARSISMRRLIGPSRLSRPCLKKDRRCGKPHLRWDKMRESRQFCGNSAPVRPGPASFFRSDRDSFQKFHTQCMRSKFFNPSIGLYLFQPVPWIGGPLDWCFHYPFYGADPLALGELAVRPLLRTLQRHKRSTTLKV
jgi:hypothetical protein